MYLVAFIVPRGLDIFHPCVPTVPSSVWDSKQMFIITSSADAAQAYYCSIKNVIPISEKNIPETIFWSLWRILISSNPKPHS